MQGPTVGVIGLGFGRAHISAFQANGCDVVAVCQRDEAVAWWQRPRGPAAWR
jgi:hypothetical protein